MKNGFACQAQQKQANRYTKMKYKVRIIVGTKLKLTNSTLFSNFEVTSFKSVVLNEHELATHKQYHIKARALRASAQGLHFKRGPDLMFLLIF